MAGVPKSSGHGLHPQAENNLPSRRSWSLGREGRGGLSSPGQADLVPSWASIIYKRCKHAYAGDFFRTRLFPPYRACKPSASPGPIP